MCQNKEKGWRSEGRLKFQFQYQNDISKVNISNAYFLILIKIFCQNKFNYSCEISKTSSAN